MIGNLILRQLLVIYLKKKKKKKKKKHIWNIVWWEILQIYGILSKFIGDHLHNLTESHTILQCTTELHTTLWLGDVLAGLCASPIRLTLYTT